MPFFQPGAGLPALLTAAVLAQAPLAAALPAIPPSHVVVVLLEDRGFDAVIGSGAAPYLDRLAGSGALMTGSAAAGGSCEREYLDLFSGSDQGIGADSLPATFTAANLGGQLLAAGRGFAGYSEDLPGPGCTGAGAGGYTRRHNPWVRFGDVPAGSNQPFSAFPREDFRNLPTVAMVVPNQDHDMHLGGVQAADAWLRTRIDPYVRWSEANNGLLVVTFAGDGRPDGDHRIATVFHGPMVRPGRYAGPVSPFSVLRTLEDLYGLGHAGAAAGAAPITAIWAGAGQAPAPASSYSITASAGAHGSITPSGTVAVAAGASQTFNVDAAAGYSIASVLVDGADQGPVCAYTFGKVAGNHTIAAAFNAPGQYTITASAGAGGSISPSGAVAVAGGASQTFTITAAAGCRISAVTVDGAGQGAIGSYTFANVTANHSISAAFTGSATGGKVISVNFTGSGASLAATEVAGVVPRSHWNAAQGAVQPVPQALVDETGATTGATVSWSASGVWSLPGSGSGGDWHMMSGYLDAVGAHTIVRVAGLPASATGYDVILYADGDNGAATRSAIYQISGSGITTTNITLTDAPGSNFTGSYRQASGSAGNYVKFTVQATAFNLTTIPSTSSDAYPRAPLNGIQILPTGTTGR